MKIPERLQDEKFRFVLIAEKGKRPIEENWTTKNNYSHNDEKIKEHEGNIGILTGNGLIIIDCDTQVMENVVRNSLPETFCVGTSTTENGFRKKHFYFRCPRQEKIVINYLGEHYGEIQALGQQCLIPGCTHPSGSKYEIMEDKQIYSISEHDLLKAFEPFMATEKKTTKRTEEFVDEKDPIVAEIKSKVKVPDVMKKYGFDMSKNPTKCLWHPSQGEKCFSYNDDLWNCFHCGRGGNVFHLVMKHESCDFQEAKRKLFDTIEKNEEIRQAITVFTDMMNMAEQFIKIQPVYFDKWKNWWLWSKKNMRWEMTDEIDILNEVDEHLNASLITTKANIRNEIVESIKRIGRKNEPKKLEETWIQFKDRIVDIKTGNEFEPTPEVFATNPIAWNLGESEDTPTMDKIFEEWVGKEYVRTLYEIISYCLLPSYPMHRIFCFVGSGSNGKTRWLELIRRFIGAENCTSSSLDEIMSSRFGSAPLFKKLVCMMGETNITSTKKTDSLKRLSGDDLIQFQFKNKDAFPDKNYAKLLISTNTLPETYDKTEGFYRRWLIIDFPNKFTEKIDILETIPKHEYENLALKSIRMLRELFENRVFHNEGTIEDRRKKYEEKSNPIVLFINENYIRDVEGKVTFKDFYNEYVTFLRERGYRELSRQEVSRSLKKEGYEMKKTALKETENITTVFILGISTQNENQQQATNIPYIPVIPHVSISNICVSPQWKVENNENNENNFKKISDFDIDYHQLPKPNQSLVDSTHRNKVDDKVIGDKLTCHKVTNNKNVGSIDKLTCDKLTCHKGKDIGNSGAENEPKISAPPMIISDFLPNILWFIGGEAQDIESIIEYFNSLPNSHIFKDKIEDYILKLKEEGVIFEAKPNFFKVVK